MKIKNQTIICSVCSKNLTGKIQVYDKGKVYCEQCNWREGKQEVYKVRPRVV